MVQLSSSHKVRFGLPPLSMKYTHDQKGSCENVAGRRGAYQEVRDFDAFTAIWRFEEGLDESYVDRRFTPNFLH